MADSKKYDGSQWEHSLRKLTTATEAVENPLYSDGTAITSYTIKGNTVQNGTPTPSNPVDVNGVGVRTGNLLDILSPEQSRWSATKTAYGVYYVADFAGVAAANRYRLSTVAGKTYTISGSIDNNLITVQLSNFLDNTSYPVEGDIRLQGTFSRTFTAQGETTLSIFSTQANQTATITDLIVYEGTVTKPYEPYGYKIPILSGGVTTNIYLTEQLMKSKDGTVNDNIASDGTATYNLVKKVYDGSESWIKEGGDSNRSVFRQPIAGLPVVGYCTHIEWKSSYASSEYNRVIVNNNQVLYISIGNSVIGGTQSITDFTSWITNQYNNGTPFTIYYIAATPTTTQITMPSIPTTDGANSITVDTTVQPSEFTATWTGWHDASVKEWDGSDWQ